MNDTNKNDAVQLSGILAKSLTTEEWVAGILILNPCSIAIMEQSISDADFTDSTCKALYRSVAEIIGNDDHDPIDFVDRLATAMEKRGVDAFQLNEFCDRLTRKIARDVCDTDAEIWSGYLADESRKKREQKRIEDAEERIVEVRQRFDRGGATLADIAEVLAAESVVLRADDGEVGKGEGEFAFIQADAIPGSPDTEWLLNSFIPKGGIVLLAGSPKGGKTTFIRLMLRACGDGGGFIGRHIKPMRVLVVTEESPRLWKRFVAEVGIGNHVSFLFQPFQGKPTLPQFTKLVGAICREVEANEIDLVILDTWSHLSPSVDENDAAGTEASLAPLRRISEVGAGLLMLHHTRKSGGEYGSGIRGSSALAGFPDVNLEISRMPGDAGDDTRRTLRATSRYEETPAEIVIEKRGLAYVEVGTTAEARRLDDISVIREILIAGPEGGMKQSEIKAAWPDDDHAPKRPCDTALFNLLKSGAERAVPIWNKSGTGHRGDAVRYSFIQFKRGIVNESIEETGSKDSFIQNLSLSVNESINVDSDLYGSKNEHSRISQNNSPEPVPF